MAKMYNATSARSDGFYKNPDCIRKKKKKKQISLKKTRCFILPKNVLNLKEVCLLLQTEIF